MALTAAAFAVASIVHSGVDIPVGFTTISDSFPGAAPPEAVIAAVMTSGAAAVLNRRTTRWVIALGTTVFALLGTAYGLTVTLDGPGTVCEPVSTAICAPWAPELPQMIELRTVILPP